MGRWRRHRIDDSTGHIGPGRIRPLRFPDKSVGFNAGPGQFFTEDIKQNMQTFTVGVNYHFGYVAPVAAPAVTK
jgi:hypothetical protein